MISLCYGRIYPLKERIDCMHWRNIYRGFAMGISDVVPGVSGGTIAVILGIYDQLIEAINGFFSKRWKEHFLFLFPLVIGMGLAIFSFSKVMKFLLAHYSGPTYYFFLGLIVGILPFLFREVDVKRTFKWYHIVLLLVGIASIISLPLNPEAGAIMTERTFSIYTYLFFSGFIASCAMILPGISGSLVLVIIGSYATIIDAVSELEFLVLLVVGTGIVIGIVTMSKVIHYFLTHYRIATFALIIGLVIGSIYVIFPGWATSIAELITSIIVFVVGFMTAILFGRVEY